MAIKTIKLEVYGRVQGVNFRSATKDFCDENEIKGYVKNLEDGAVEVIAQGTEEKLKKLIWWLKKSPGFSKVKNVFIEDLETNEIFKEFKIIKEDSFLFDRGKSFKSLGKSFLKL